MTQLLLSIDIPFDPNITSFGGLLVTWHGVFTAVGIVVGVWLAARIAHDEKQRPTFAYRIIGRLRDGVSLDVARAEVDGVSAMLRAAFPLWQSADFQIRVEPLHAYLVEQSAPAIVALLGGMLYGWNWLDPVMGIVGSALVRRVLDGEGPEGAGRFVASLRRALDEAGA